jgi:hypothetical protein
MTTMLTCRVDDYDSWRPRYDAAMQHVSDVQSWRGGTTRTIPTSW